ncbi:MAG: single-stranded DNA-binding protein [Candidatus Doudnabacteria bacterium]|nr:single-stranded DNA-binding protein [Candidatus Doudnabacteria bacterium]
MDLNKVMIIGRLTRDPELRSTPNGAQVVSFSVATGFSWTDQSSGQKKEQTEFHNVVAWRKLAEIIAQYLKKGSQVYIEGRLQTRSWEGQDGKKNYRTEIVADNMIMLGSRSSSSSAPAPEASMPEQSQAPASSPSSESIPEIQIDDSDIPF